MSTDCVRKDRFEWNMDPKPLRDLVRVMNLMQQVPKLNRWKRRQRRLAKKRRN